jgi:superfamily II DNA or RNA helicase
MFIEWLCEHKEFSNELSSIIRVSKRENYVSIKYSNIIREYENIFSCIKNEQNNPEKIIELGHTCLKKIPSYVMCKYIITILERYNTFAESEDLKVKVSLLKKNIKKSKYFLLECDLDMLNNVFSIEMPSQEDFDQCVSEILNIPIRHPNAKEKEESKTSFQNSKEVRVLVSSDAGGYGVDLPQANLLVNFDLPWSSGTAVQRNSRIRRASSTWSHVVIQDFLVLNSIEERQHQMLMQKNAVADAVMDGTGINTKGGVDLTVGSLLNFLKGE